MHSLVFTAQFLITAVGIGLVYWLARAGRLPVSLTNSGMPAWAIGLGVLALIVFELVCFKASSPPDRFWDFLNAYYLAGQAALNNDPSALRDLIGRGVTGFVNIPIVAYWFLPFALMPSQVAALVFTAIGLVSVVAAWFLLVRLAGLELRERWLLAILFIANGPLLNGIKFGNLSYFILFLLAAGLVLVRRGHSSAAGVLLGLCAVMKPPLALFGLFFLFRKDIAGLLGFVLVGVATAVLSLTVYGWSDNLYWFQACILQYSRGWLSTFSVQSISAFIFRLRDGVGIDYLDSPLQLPTPGESIVEKILIGVLLVAAAVAWIRSVRSVDKADDSQAERRCDLQYLLVLCLVLVSSPLSWDRYYCWLLLPTAFFLGYGKSLARSSAMRGLGWLAIALTTPLVMRPISLEVLGGTAFYKSFAVSHILFGGLLWFAVVAWWLAGSGKTQPHRAGEPGPLVSAKQG